VARLDSIDDFRIFDAVVRTGNLSSAARELDLSLTSVSKRLKRIEDVLSLRLINRTTRQLSLTPEGEAFAERARAIIAAVSDAEELSAAGTIRGVVRVTATVAFARRQLAPRLPRFLALHPNVEVQVNTSDRIVDLVGEKIDLAFRQAPLGDGRLITRTIAPDGLLLVASPDYLARAGTPAEPADLARHFALTVGDPPPRHWSLHRASDEAVVPITSVISSLDGEVAHTAALAGGGIAMKASWDVIDDLGSGRLVRVLPQWWGAPRMLRVVFPMRTHQPLRVRALVDFMEIELREASAQAASLNLFPS
jgi:DNA-binding transcriptional LysR family regulator